MEKRWEERFRNWWEESEARLKKRWYLWPLPFAIDLANHYFSERCIRFLEEKSPRTAAFLIALAGRLPIPATALLLIGTALLAAGVLIYSFFATREKSPLPWDASITPLEIFFERSSNPSITYKSNVRIILKNESGQSIVASRPSWQSDGDSVPIQWPLGSTYQLEGPGGWQHDKWGQEVPEIAVAPDTVFRLWIGLQQNISDGELRRRHRALRLGILSIPLKIAGRDGEFRLRL
jgi:hypothetical protein